MTVELSHPERGRNVADWLKSRHEPPRASAKEYSWSFMAGGHAENGCEDFLRAVWRDEWIAIELERRLRASGAWQLAEILADVDQTISQAVVPDPQA